MPMAYWVSVTLHVLAAMFWLGGMIFLGVVGAPVLRAVEPPAVRQRVFQVLGERFRAAGWTAIAILILTGVINLHFRGLLVWSGVLGNPAFWRSTMGTALAVKLAAVAIMVVLSAIHDFVSGPAAGRLKAGSPESIRLRRQAAIMGRVNAFLGIILVLAAVRLARGG